MKTKTLLESVELVYTCSIGILYCMPYLLYVDYHSTCSRHYSENNPTRSRAAAEFGIRVYSSILLFDIMNWNSRSFMQRLAFPISVAHAIFIPNN
jgi:hypothetical protein